MKEQKDVLLFSESNYKKDTLIQVVQKEDEDVVNLVIINNGNTFTIPFSLQLEDSKGELKNLPFVLNNINRANIIGRAGLTIKNFLKKTMFKKLLDKGEINQEEYEKYMGDLINKV